MMVVVGVLCMIGFSIAGVIDYSTDRSRGGGGEDPIVATAYGKNLRASEVHQMVRRRALVINFMAQCRASAMNFPDYAQLFANLYEYRFGPPTDEAVVTTWVLNERARQMGIVIDDHAINAFIRSETADKVNSDVLQGIAKQLGAGSPQIFDALRGELLAMRLREMALSGLQTTPAQRWDYYRRQRQRATIEAVPIRIEDLADQVPDAPEEQLRAFFDTHKDKVPDPESPDPGFKVPKKASFTAVVARFDDFLDVDSVTAAEINEHYEKFKDTRYLWDEFAFGQDDGDDTPAQNSDKPTDTSGEKATGEESVEGKASGNGADDKPTDGENKKGANSDEQSSLMPATGNLIAGLLSRPTSVFGGLLAADDEEATSDAKQPSDEKPADEAANKNQTVGIVDKPADTPAAVSSDTKSVETTSSDQKSDSKATSKKIKRPAVPPPITSEYLLPRDIRQGSHPKHAPLWQVEDSIRKELARDKASKKIDEALRVVREKMRKHSRLMEPEDTELKMPDLETVAESQHLSVLKTGLLSRLELKEKFPDLANAFGEQRNLTFDLIGYSGLGKFQNTTLQDVDANRYLVWKTEEQDEYVPEFADVRSKVLRVWKIVKARDLAVKKADELADEATKAQRPLKDVFASRSGLTVIQPPPFSWLTRGIANVDNRSPPRESEIEGIESPGPNFMQTVFNLGVGGAGEAMNKPQTMVYVVRVQALEPSREVLRAGFLADDFSLYYEVAMEDRQRAQERWVKGIESEAGLTWKTPQK